MQLLFASSNQNKIREITQLLPQGCTLLGLKDAGITDEIPEPGGSIRENAFLKAQYVTERWQGEAVFADDSGLEVEVLGGAPGVYSARYSGIPKNDSANNEKLLRELEGSQNRTARFVTVIALIMDGKTWYFEGEVKGTITSAPAGSNGFGYDPLFIPEGYDKTFAELSPEIKNAISHRGKAVKQLIDFLRAK